MIRAAPSGLTLVADPPAARSSSFDVLYRTHVDRVHARLLRMLGPIADIDDLTQQVFISLHRALPTFRGEAALSTYVCRITINVALDHLRRRKRRRETLTPDHFDNIAEQGGSPERQLDQRQQLALLFELLERIKPDKRVAFCLHTIEGLTFREIADIVVATPETVAKRVQHARRELGKMIERRQRAAARRCRHVQ